MIFFDTEIDYNVANRQTKANDAFKSWTGVCEKNNDLLKDAKISVCKAALLATLTLGRWLTYNRGPVRVCTILSVLPRHYP